MTRTVVVLGRYGTAALCVALAAAVSAGVRVADTHFTLIIIFAAVTLSAAVGGRGPGLFAAVSGCVYLIYADVLSPDAGSVARLALFTLTALLVVSLGEKARRRRAEAEESEHRYRRLVELLPNPVAVHRSGRFLLANTAAAQAAGLSDPSELLKYPVQNFIHPDQREQVAERLRLVEEKGVHAGPVEVKGMRVDGSTVDVELEAVQVGFGGCAATQSIMLDVSARKLTEDALRRAEEKYRSIFEHAVEGIFQSTPDGRFISVNPALAVMLGYESPDEMIETITSMEVQFFADPERRSELRRLLEERGQVQNFVYQAMRKDRTFLWVMENVRAVRDDDGCVLYYEGFVIDIDEHKQVEESLRESESRLRMIFEHEPECVKLVAHDGTLVEMNPAGLRMIEADSLEQVRGHSVYPLVSEADRDEFVRLTERVFRGETGSIEFEMIGLKGTRRRLEMRAAPLRNAEGGVRALLAVTRDITARRRAEEAVREADQRAIREYERLLERLAKLAQSLGAARDLVTVFRVLRDFSVAFVPCETFFVALYDPEHGVRNGVYYWHDDEERDPSEIGPIPVRMGPTGKALKTGQVIVSNDYLTDLMRPGVVSAFDHDPRWPRSAVIAPMNVMGRTIGVVEAQSYELGAYTAEHATAMRMAANLAAIAIENLQLFERETRARAAAEESDRQKGKLLGWLVTAEEDERRRFARELHDEAGQQLAAFRIGLKMLEGATREDEAASAQLARLRELADQLDACVHHLAWQLRPAALDDLGLHSAIASYAARWSEHSGVRVDLHANGFVNERLPSHSETTLYRVVQEALTNVLKHADAKSVGIILERRRGMVSAIVEDDGRGFDAEAVLGSADVERRMGLSGMRERVALVGGTLEVESALGLGTTVYARLPIAPAAGA